MENLQNNNDTCLELSENTNSTIDEKSETIAHKDIALKRLDTSFNKHIELTEYKKANILAYWIEDFSQYHDNEKTFNCNSFKIFKRGDIVKVNLGFNIGKELGGLHYCVVLDKKDNPYNGTLNVIPLSSAKENKTYNSRTCINLGDELYTLINQKLENEIISVGRRLSMLNNSLASDKVSVEIKSISDKISYLSKMRHELSKMKHGSFALVHQITTISKQRIYKTSILSGIKLSNNSLDLLDAKIKSMFTK